MLNIESKRAAEPKHRQQTRIERDGTDLCPSCTSSCTPSARHPRLEFGRNGEDANACYANLCSTVARPASRAPRLSLVLSPSHSARRHVRHARHALSLYLDELAILEEPVVSWEYTRCHQFRGRPLNGRVEQPSQAAYPSQSSLAMLRRQDQAFVMQMPVCRRLCCLTDLHLRHPTATPALKLRLLQSCQSPRQAAFEDLRCLPPPGQRSLPVGKPTLTAAPPATTDQELVSVGGGDPQPLQKKSPLVHASRVFQAPPGA